MNQNLPKSKPISFEDYSLRHRQRIARKLQNARSGDKQAVGDSQHNEAGSAGDCKLPKLLGHYAEENQFSEGEEDLLYEEVHRLLSTSRENENICDKIGDTDEENDYINDSFEDEEEAWFSSDDGESEDDLHCSNNSFGTQEFSNTSVESEGSSNNSLGAQDGRLLYSGARITVAESLLAILTVSLRHKFTGAALADVLALIELHCPARNWCKKSLYLFKKYFANIHTPLRRHFYCSNCYSPLKESTVPCAECPVGTEVCYFIEIPVIGQLRKLYQRFDFFDLLQARFNKIKVQENDYEDIYDGQIYQELSKPPNILSSPDNISFTWNTDGAALFKSSNFQIWPFFLSINELPFNERTKKENLLLAGLWFGPKKPFPPVFLNPIAQELEVLERGVDLTVPSLNCTISVRATVICGTCDLPAGALFLNMKYFNGEYGCRKCKIRSERYEETSVRVYPFERHLDHRTQEETDNFAEEAVSTDEAVCGVKGPSAVAPFFPHYIRGTAVDVMHAVFLGVVKALLILWFSTNFSDKEWSLSKFVTIVDKYLCAIKPPAFVPRLPRSISENLHHLKASELKTWLYYYSVPILKSIMQTAYFEHYLLLVNAMSLLNTSSISEDMINLADELLLDFVARFPDLYDKRYMTANLHQLLHLPQTVRDFGPLWVTSCSAFENANGELKALVTGTRFSGLQICTGLSYFMAIPELLENLAADNFVYKFCKKVNNPQKKYKSFRISSNSFAIGAMKGHDQIPDVVSNILLSSHLTGTNLGIFYRYMRSGILYSSEMYQRCTKTNSCCVKYNVNGKDHFGIIKCFIRDSNCQCCSYCSEDCDVTYKAVLRKCTVTSKFNAGLNGALSRFYRCNLTNNTLVTDVTNLCTVCFYIQITDEATYIIEPINLIELE